MADKHGTANSRTSELCKNSERLCPLGGELWKWTVLVFQAAVLSYQKRKNCGFRNYSLRDCQLTRFPLRAIEGCFVLPTRCWRLLAIWTSSGSQMFVFVFNFTRLPPRISSRPPNPHPNVCLCSKLAFFLKDNNQIG